MGQLFGIGGNCNNIYNFESNSNEENCEMQYFSISEQDKQGMYESNEWSLIISDFEEGTCPACAYTVSLTF